MSRDEALESSRQYFSRRIAYLLQEIDRSHQEIALVNSLMKDLNITRIGITESSLPRRVEAATPAHPVGLVVRPPIRSQKSTETFRSRPATPPLETHPAHRPLHTSQSRFPLFRKGSGHK